MLVAVVDCGSVGCAGRRACVPHAVSLHTCARSQHIVWAYVASLSVRGVHIRTCGGSAALLGSERTCAGSEALLGSEPSCPPWRDGQAAANGLARVRRHC